MDEMKTEIPNHAYICWLKWCCRCVGALRRMSCERAHDIQRRVHICLPAASPRCFTLDKYYRHVDHRSVGRHKYPRHINPHIPPPLSFAPNQMCQLLDHRPAEMMMMTMKQRTRQRRWRHSVTCTLPRNHQIRQRPTREWKKKKSEKRLLVGQVRKKK
jgi:hypothetical protein